MNVAWRPVQLGSLLKKAEEVVWPVADARYTEVTVRLWGRGVVPRGVVDGLKLVGQRRFRARAGQFIASRIDARNGALGVVPASLDGAIVTNDFPLFDVDPTRLDPEFLGWLSRTESFVGLCRRASEGTTNRVRLKEERFLALEIALPPVDEQRRILSRIEAIAGKVEEAKRLKQEATEALGVLRSVSAERERQELLRQFPELSLAEVSHSITDGDHNTPDFNDSGIRFIFVGNVSSAILHFDGAKFVSRGYFEKLQPRRVPTRGDILFSAVGATLGIPAVVETDEPFCFQRHIAILKLNQAQVVPKFVWHMLQATSVFRAAWKATTGSAQPTIPLRGIRGLSIPVPPIEVQIDAVARLERVRAASGSVEDDDQLVITGLRSLLPAVLDKAFRGEM